MAQAVEFISHINLGTYKRDEDDLYKLTALDGTDIILMEEHKANQETYGYNWYTKIKTITQRAFFKYDLETVLDSFQVLGYNKVEEKEKNESK